jgi:hypothetical protein
MPRKPQSPRKTSDPEQLKRFKEMAREVGADESADAMDRAFEKVAKPKTAASRPKAQR